jgi:hypothetical protein
MYKHFLVFTAVIVASQTANLKSDIYILNPTRNAYQLYFSVKKPTLTKKSVCSSNFRLDVNGSDSIIYHFSWPCSLDTLKKITFLKEDVELVLPKETSLGKHLFIIINQGLMGTPMLAASDLIPLPSNGNLIIKLLTDTGKYYKNQISSQF